MKMFSPDIFTDSVTDINPYALYEIGWRNLILDMDNTIISRDTYLIPKEVETWLDEVQDAGFNVYLITNNWHSTVMDYAEKLEMNIIHKAMKPFPLSFWIALKRMGAKRSNTLVVGDQLMTDIIGAKLARIPSIMVKPLSSTDLVHTLFLRKVENLLITNDEKESKRKRIHKER